MCVCVCVCVCVQMLWMMHNVLKQYNEEQEPFPDGLYDDLPS